MLEAPEGQVTGGNWATRSQAEVDGIPSATFNGFTPTVYPRRLFNLIEDHPPEESKCAVCSRPDEVMESNTSMRVHRMCPTLRALKPYRWLA